MMRGKRENFFSREKKFSRSPRAPLTLSRKAKKLFYLLLPTFVGNKAFSKKTTESVTVIVRSPFFCCLKKDLEYIIRIPDRLPRIPQDFLHP